MTSLKYIIVQYWNANVYHIKFPLASSYRFKLDRYLTPEGCCYLYFLCVSSFLVDCCTAECKFLAMLSSTFSAKSVGRESDGQVPSEEPGKTEHSTACILLRQELI